MAGGWTSRPRESRALGGWIASRFSLSTRRQPSASMTSGARRSPRSVWTVWTGPRVIPSTLAVSKVKSPWAASSSQSWA